MSDTAQGAPPQTGCVRWTTAKLRQCHATARFDCKPSGQGSPRNERRHASVWRKRLHQLGSRLATVHYPRRNDLDGQALMASMDAEAHNELNTPETPAVQAQRRFSVWRQCRGIFSLHPKRIGALVVRAYSDWSADNATRLGAALAYYTLFSIAPVLVVVTGIAGIVIGQSSARAEISPWLQRFLSPEGARAAELMFEQHITAT